MFLLLVVVLQHFASAVDEIHKKPIALDGVIDERTTYIPLGSNYAFPCQAQILAKHLTRAFPSWNVLYYHPEEKRMKSSAVGSMNDLTNDRFRVDSSGSLLAFGMQKWHDGVVVECFVNTSETTNVISRNIIAIQDCSGKNDSMDRKNPCLYGSCHIWGIENLYQAVHCNCSPQFTGQFCDVPVKGVLWRELWFFSPLLTMFFAIILLYFFSDSIEFAGKEKKMKFEKHMAPANIFPDMRKLYPAKFITQEEVQRVLALSSKSKKEPKQSDDGNDGHSGGGTAQPTRASERLATVKSQKKLDNIKNGMFIRGLVKSKRKDDSDRIGLGLDKTQSEILSSANKNKNLPPPPPPRQMVSLKA